MISIKETSYYKDAIHELNLDFGNFYLFEHFLVAEIHENLEVSWHKHFKDAVKMVYELYDGEGLVYITNRIHNYSINPSDWIHFFKCRYALKGYGIVSYDKKGRFSIVFEKLFMRSKMRNFDNLDGAIHWAKNLTKHALEEEVSAA